MDRPLVTIIVPVYNVEQYLDRCVESIVGQSLKNIEIILVDDASPDSCPSLCDEWAKRDLRIRVIHKKNEGLGLTRNAGMRMATGRYVAFVDSDDFVDLDMFRQLYEECQKHKLDCIYSEFNVDEYPGFRVVLRPERLYNGKEEVEQLRLDIVGSEPSFISGVKYHCSTCKGLYSLSVIRENSVIFHSERQYISEDLLFNLDFLKYANRVKIVPMQFYHYCLNDSSLSHSSRPDKFQKLVFMLQTLASDTSFVDRKEFELRLKRTAIFYSMSGIRQEKNRRDISFIQKIKNVNAIENTTEIVNAVKDYPIRELPLKWKVYTILLKNNLLRFTFFFVV